MNEAIKDYLQQQFEELQKQIMLSGKNVLNVKELAMLTGLSVGYIYNLVSGKDTPLQNRRR